jgi:hypothetical protein
MGVKDEQRKNPRRAGKASSRSAFRRSSDVEFVNLELDTEQVGEYRQWRQDIEEVCSVWSEVLEEGYRVNTKYDDYSSAYAAFIIPDEQSENAGYILTGRGGNPYRAVSEALYKHRFLLPGGWATYPNRPRVTDDNEF